MSEGVVTCCECGALTRASALCSACGMEPVAATSSAPQPRLKYLSAPPDGHPGMQTRIWDWYRRMVRDVAARWCDRPVVTHEEAEAKLEEACGDCAACEANEVLMRGGA